MKFGLFSTNLKPQDLVKARTSKGAILVSNDQVLEYAYNQFIEGEESVDIITPDGVIHNRTFLTARNVSLSGAAFSRLSNPKESRMSDDAHPYIYHHKEDI